MLIFDVYTDGEVRQNNGTYSYSYGKRDNYPIHYSPNYWWLRSPYTDYTIFAWQVYPEGTLPNYHGNVDNSCGKIISPGTENIDWGFRVLLDGDVRYINTLVINSYG